MKKLIENMHQIFAVIKIDLIAFYNFIDRNFIKILSIIYIAISLLFVKNELLIILAIISVCFIIAIAIYKTIHKAFKENVVKDYKRFTVKKSNGDIEVSKNRLNQAIIFLSYLEDEYEKK